jgi:hypothetical protein
VAFKLAENWITLKVLYQTQMLMEIEGLT